MKAYIYKNLEELSYGELLKALENIKEKTINTNDNKDIAGYSEYYKALVAELDKRSKYYENT